MASAAPMRANELEAERSILAPSEEFAHRLRVGAAVAAVGSEEFDEVDARDEWWQSARSWPDLELLT
jgi:hypothetical protein